MAVLATLAIHPKYTSKLADSAAHDVSSLAMSYLRTVLAIVGPVNANLRDAFLFRGENGRRRRSSEHSGLEGMESEEDHVRGKTANKGSVWARGQDFWKVLGWAFNCSAQHPHRWRWWQPWLEYMVDVLESDYKERKRLDVEREGSQDSYEYQLLQESLLVSYVMPRNSRVSPLKPIMSALFADGNTSSQAIFKEVFTRENKVASKSSKKRKRDRVDLENDKFGDYDDDSSTGGSEPPTPEHLRVLTMDVKNDTALWTSTSLLETVPLRLRLFNLVRNPRSQSLLPPCPSLLLTMMAVIRGSMRHAQEVRDQSAGPLREVHRANHATARGCVCQVPVTARHAARRGQSRGHHPLPDAVPALGQGASSR